MKCNRKIGAGMLSVALVAALLWGAPWVQAEETAETRDGVFIHITHGAEDAHRLLMALQMARMMSADHPVLVYFDIDGIHAVLKTSEDVSHDSFPSAKEQIAALTENGVILMACPGCLNAAGESPENLMEGVAVADKERFFNFTSGRILSFDY